MTGRIRPVTDGVSRLTDKAKSVIHSEETACAGEDGAVIVFVLKENVFFNCSSHEKRERGLAGRSGIKGSVRKPRNKNHKRYCMRPVRCFCSTRLKTRKIPKIALIRKLQNKKQIIKSVTSMSSFFRCFCKKGAKRINFGFRQLVIFNVSRKHICNRPIIITF